MTKLSGCDFRESFEKMAPQAVLNRQELAVLLSTTVGAVSQMAYRGELPPNAFPHKRRACWFVADIKQWLSAFVADRERPAPIPVGLMPISTPNKIGRPRKTCAYGIR